MRYLFTLTLAIATLVTSTAPAAYFLKNGKLINAKDVATKGPDEHFAAGIAAFEGGKYGQAVSQFRVITASYPASTQAQEAAYYLGVSLLRSGDCELANNALNEYLKGQSHPKFFEEAIKHKLAIADRFREGARRHLLGMESMPKWASGKKTALSLYDEVTSALPSHEIAAQAFYRKAQLLADMRDYRESVDCLQTLIKRFPKHELAPESHLAISRTYIVRSETEFQNRDLLSLAQLNLRKFQSSFPGDPRISEVEKGLMTIKETYAQGLYDTGRFYERVKKPKASILYYRNAIYQFPETAVAQACEKRLKIMGVAVEEPSQVTDL